MRQYPELFVDTCTHAKSGRTGKDRLIEKAKDLGFETDKLIIVQH